VVAAALVFGGAVVLGYSAVSGDTVRVLAAVGVAAVGAGVALLPDAGVTGHAAGTGLVVLGAGLAGTTLGEPGVVLAIVLAGLACTGMPVWISGAGVLVAVVLPDASLVAVAAVLAVVVVFAPARAWWGDLAGAAAGMAVVGQTSVVAAVVAAVLLMTAAIRRDLVTGLLAAAVLAVPAPAHAWPAAVVVVVALVAIRVPRVRAALTRVPPALRGVRSAHAVAGAAAVAASGLVCVALQLPFWWLTLLTVLLAGALGHWLPAPAGPALAVVAIAGLGLALPWQAPVLDLVTALAAAPLLRRHPTPPVFAAAAYLALRVLPWLDPVVTTLLVGAVAAVLAFGRRTAPVGQTMGAVVLGAVAFGPVAGLPHLPDPVLLVPVVVLAVSTGWRASAALAVAAGVAAYRLVAHAAGLVDAAGLVAAVLVVAAAALVVSAVFATRRDLMARVR
jgi:hypothetical protein